MKKNIFLLSIFLVTSNRFAFGGSYKHLPADKEKAQLTQNIQVSGLCFTPNKGQVADVNGNLCPDVLYKACLPDRQGNTAGADVYLRKTGISYLQSNMGEVIHKADGQVEELIKTGIIATADKREKKNELIQKQSMKIHRVDMDFADCNDNITAVNEDELEGYHNYYYAHCPKGIMNVKQYSKITYQNIYKNIDIVFYGTLQDEIKYDIIVQAHADPGQIKLCWKGADNIHINREGNLVIKTRINEFYESMPKVYQNIDGQIVDVKAKYILTSISAGDAVVTFSFSNYNSNYPLIIDPATRIWATYFGGTYAEIANDITTDACGNVYMVGRTDVSTGLAYAGFQNANAGSTDAFLVKFDAAGNRLWSTYYGGTGPEEGQSVATDAFGNVYIAGRTESAAGIASGGFQNIMVGFNDAYLVKFDAAGSRLWGTYYGGNTITGTGDLGYAVATDALGNVYLSGSTYSTNGIFFAGFQNVLSGGQDAFLVKFNAAGSRLWATYYGGTGWDTGQDIATDALGNVYLSGQTNSIAGIASGGFQNTISGNYEAFLVKFTAGGSRTWATYYGGLGNETGCHTITDVFGNVYLDGTTTSITGISSGGFQNTYGGGTGDAFLVKFTSAGSRLWATYYGGTLVDDGRDLITDASGNVFLTGMTHSASGIASGGFQNTYIGAPVGWGWDAYLAEFNASGTRLCATYYGGTNDDFGSGVAVDSCGSVYMTGSTGSWTNIASGGFQNTNGGGPWDAFLVKFTSCGTPPPASVLKTSFTNTACGCTGTATVIVPATGCAAYGYSWSSAPIQTTPTATGLCAGLYTVTVTSSGGCSPMRTATVNIGNGGNSLMVNTIIDNTSCTALNSITASPVGGVPSYTYLWSNGQTSATATGIPSGIYTVTITDAAGCTGTATTSVVSHPPLGGLFTKGTSGCIGCSCKQWILISATGGTSPYSYSWPDGYVNRYKNQLCPGSYTINIKDKNGCSVNVSLIAP